MRKTEITPKADMVLNFGMDFFERDRLCLICRAETWLFLSWLCFSFFDGSERFSMEKQRKCIEIICFFIEEIHRKTHEKLHGNA